MQTGGEDYDEQYPTPGEVRAATIADQNGKFRND